MGLIGVAPVTVPSGNPEDFLTVFDIQNFNDGIGARLTLQATSGYGNMYYVIIADGNRQALVYLKEQTKTYANIIYNPNVTNHVISIACIGEWDTIPANCNLQIQQDNFTANKGNYAYLSFDAMTEVKSYDDSNQFSNWSLNGLDRYLTGYRVSGFSTQLQIDLVLSSILTVHTLELYLNGQVIATGTITGNGTITLVEANNSGLSGTVDLVHSVDLDYGTSHIRARYAKAYKVYLDSVYNSTINDTGRGEVISTRIGPLASGTHSIQVRSISDTGIEGALSSALTVDIPARPEPVSNLQVISGNYLSTLITWLPSSTAGVSYNVYDSAINGPVNLSSAVQNLVGVNAVLPATSLEAGFRRVIVSSSLAGIEDGSNRICNIEYDSNGNVIPSRPNNPSYKFNSITSGNKLIIDWYYDRIEEIGQAAKANLYIFSGVPTIWNSPRAIENIGGSHSLLQGQLSATVDTNGMYNYSIRASTLSGILSSTEEYQGPVWLSTISPSVPTNLTAKVI
jgi:hypothetical protein